MEEESFSAAMQKILNPMGKQIPSVGKLNFQRIEQELLFSRWL